MKNYKIKINGLKPDAFDERDYVMTIGYEPLPKKYSIRNQVTEIKNQGNLGSCGPHAITSAYELLRKQKTGYRFQLSELYLYYYARKLNGRKDFATRDTGITMRNGLKAIKNGCSLDYFWPYVISKYSQEPNLFARMCANLIKIKSYYRIYFLEDIKRNIYYNNPVLCGIFVFNNIYESYNNNGIIPMPKSNSKKLGGHALMITGYDDNKKMFQVLNSWGDVGDKGFFYIPYEYAEKYMFDIWTIKI